MRRQLLCFPKGNKPGQLSLFLAVPENEDQPMGWQRSASFKLTVLSAHGREHDVSKDATHTFLGTENDWGEPPRSACAGGREGAHGVHIGRRERIDTPSLNPALPGWGLPQLPVVDRRGRRPMLVSAVGPAPKDVGYLHCFTP